VGISPITVRSYPSFKPCLGRLVVRGATLAAATGAALAAAGPALAADDLVPLPPSPAPPAAAPEMQLSQAVPDPPAIPLPPAPPAPLEPLSEVEPPITVAVTDDETGNIDVSVRVLSPGSAETTSEQGAEPVVVSESETADITGEAAAAPPSSEDATTTDATGSNVNVSVRVLSPGDDGSVEQTNAQDAGIDELGATEVLVDAPATGLADTDVAATDTSSAPDHADEPAAKNAAQYHDPDSRYQSDRQSPEPTWHWTWYLSMDCNGDALSSSAETGAQSSLDWVWEWSWEWSCGSPPRPPPLEPNGATPPNEGSSSAAASDPDDAPAAAESGPEVDAAGEPWLWSWTFTFCGETVSTTMPIATRRELRWQWDWSWSWTCETPDSEPAPTTADTPAPSSSVQAQEPSETAPSEGATAPEPVSAMPMPFGMDALQFPASVIPHVAFTELLLISPRELMPALQTELLSLPDTLEATTIAVLVEVDVVLPPHVDLIPAGPGDESTAPLASPYPLGRSGGTATLGDTSRARASAPSRWQPARAAPARPRNPGTVKPTEQRSASEQKRRAPRSPVGLPPLRVAGVGGPSGSFVPSGSVVATAALVAFLFLTAPSLGWRIRVARELRPRGTYGPSIDHPG
jgi:hypothetical protein